MEIRSTPQVVELRKAESRTVGGYAAVFNSESKNLGGFIEVLNPRAFDAARDEGFPGVLARYNHEDNFLLGTSDNGTLRLNVDDKGLIYEVDMPNSRSDILELIERGDVRQSSFAFTIRDDGDEWEYSEQRDVVIRTVYSVNLYDVAPVNNPAYSAATVGVRSLAIAKNADPAEVEQLAKNGELKRLFKRTDLPAAPKFTGWQARMSLPDM
jgi:HK97 family phage prohead protease